jgi:hypothetical protein
MHHKEASFFMSRMILGTVGEIPSKMHALRCFQRHHRMRVTRELEPAWAYLGTFTSAVLHHSWKFSSPGSVVHLCNPTNDNIWNQTSLENTHTHPTMMCWTFSSSCSHNRQCNGWSNPRRARRSAVQQRLSDANHMKNLHLGHLDGAHVPHILLDDSNWTAPMNSLSYADVEE